MPLRTLPPSSSFDEDKNRLIGTRQQDVDCYNLPGTLSLSSAVQVCSAFRNMGNLSGLEKDMRAHWISMFIFLTVFQSGASFRCTSVVS